MSLDVLSWLITVS